MARPTGFEQICRGAADPFELAAKFLPECLLAHVALVTWQELQVDRSHVHAAGARRAADGRIGVRDFLVRAHLSRHLLGDDAGVLEARARRRFYGDIEFAAVAVRSEAELRPAIAADFQAGAPDGLAVGAPAALQAPIARCASGSRRCQSMEG